MLEGKFGNGKEHHGLIRRQKMKLLVFLICLAVSDSVRAQGISTARDRNGNLVERGAATRTYASVPMANSAVVRLAQHGSVIVARHRTVIIQPRR